MSQEKPVYSFRTASDALREKAIALHHQRYCEVGYFEINEQDKYQNDSVYFIAQIPELQKIVGVIRLIFKGLDELPTIKHFEIYDIEKARLSQLESYQYGEISAFTKLCEHDVGLGLIRTVLQYSLKQGITHWVCCIDERVYKYMHRMFKFPFKTIGISKVYLGSVSIPCVLDLSECLDTLFETRRQLYQYLVSFEQNNEVGVVR